MSKEKQLRTGVTVGPDMPMQELRESISQHTQSLLVAHQCVNIYNRAYQCGSSEIKDIYGPFGHSQTTFETKFTGT